MIGFDLLTNDIIKKNKKNKTKIKLINKNVKWNFLKFVKLYLYWQKEKVMSSDFSSIRAPFDCSDIWLFRYQLPERPEFDLVSKHKWCVEYIRQKKNKKEYCLLNLPHTLLS